MSYAVISYYMLQSVADPAAEVQLQKQFLQPLEGRSRIYVSPQGINGQLALPAEHTTTYTSWIAERFPGSIDWKIQYDTTNPFPRLTVKQRRELVALGAPVDLSPEARGTYLTPSEWKQQLETASDDTLVLDVRNDYEWKLGHFRNSHLFSCNTFRDFQEAATKISQRITAKTRVLMYCTGGIRCEIFSSLLKREGIANIFQLRGGVIRYGEEVGSAHWLGKLFVFDDRLAVPLSDEETPAIGTCHYCGTTTERYYNCANMDCNELFLCCSSCLEQSNGCCQPSCGTAARIRPYQLAHKPFRRKHTYCACHQ